MKPRYPHGAAFWYLRRLLVLLAVVVGLIVGALRFDSGIRGNDYWELLRGMADYFVAFVLGVAPLVAQWRAHRDRGHCTTLVKQGEAGGNRCTERGCS